MIWLDAHLSPRIARWVTEQLGVPCVPLREVGLHQAEDSEIWEAARNSDVILMTKDSDFEERVRRLGPPPAVILLTCGNTSEAHLCRILRTSLPIALEMIQGGETLVELC